MRRFLLWSGFGFVFVSALVSLALRVWSAKPQPFHRVYQLPKGGTVVVEGEEFDDGHLDMSETDHTYPVNYKVLLQRPGQNVEIVEEETGNDFDSGSGRDVPSGPFRLQREGGFLFLASQKSVFARPLQGRNWTAHNLMSDRDIPFWGRATRPDSFARDDALSGPDSNYQEINRRLVWPVPYAFERWNLKKRFVVVMQNREFDARWPRRLIFENWKFSPQKTMALEPKWKLRPFPRGVKFDLVALDFANFDDIPSYFRVEEAAKVRGARLMWKKTLPLSASTSALPLQHWWTQKGPATLQIRGVCADPNPRLLHFQWRVGQGEWFWTVARQNQQLEVREDEGALEAPYLYARFHWPEGAASFKQKVVSSRKRQRFRLGKRVIKRQKTPESSRRVFRRR